MKDIALDAYGDISAFGDGGAWVSDVRQVAQALRIRLRTHLAEYFLDSRMGLPWLDWLGKASATMLGEIEVSISREILATSGVSRLTKRVSATWVRDTKTIQIEFECVVRTPTSEQRLTVTATAAHTGAIVLMILDQSGAVI